MSEEKTSPGEPIKMVDNSQSGRENLGYQPRFSPVLVTYLIRGENDGNGAKWIGFRDEFDVKRARLSCS